MIFPLGFTRQYEFVMFKKMISDPCALEYLLNLGERCRNEKTATLCLPDDFISAAMGLPPTVDPVVTKHALIECGFISPAHGKTDVFEIPLFTQENANLIARWKNGAMGGRPKGKISESTSPSTADRPHMERAREDEQCVHRAALAPSAKENLDEDVPF